MDQRATLAETFVEVADTLVADFDLIDFLDRLCHRSVDLFSVDASGIMLRDTAASCTSSPRRTSRAG
ncbi:MAG: hypothetical protein WKF58_17915 [Ilumatobacteraceae bacterium]